MILRDPRTSLAQRMGLGPRRLWLPGDDRPARLAMRRGSRPAVLVPRHSAAQTGEAPSFSNVILLENHQGTNGSTSFVDASPVGRTLAATGNAQISTAQFIYGDSSAIFDGSGDYVALGTPINIAPSSSTSWSTSVWFRSNEASRLSPETSRYFQVNVNSGGASQVTRMLINTATGARSITGTTTNSAAFLIGTTDIAANTWYFIRVVNDGPNNTCKLYVNGVEEASGTRKGLLIDRYGAGYSSGITNYWNGYIGPLRVSTEVEDGTVVPDDLFPEA